MANISLWVENGCLSSCVTTMLDAFTIANIWHQNLAGKEVDPLFEPHIVSTEGKPIMAQGNLKMEVEMAIDDVESTDCIILSPLLPNITPLPNNLGLFRQWLEKMRDSHATIATVCTGTFLLAEMGLLDGKKATTNWQYARLFQKRYPKVQMASEYMLTEDDNIICSGAATSIYNLSIHLIKKFGSQKLATTCSKALLVDTNRVSQAPYTLTTPPRLHGDAQVLKAQQIIERNYSQIKRIDDIAQNVGISPRHFKRRFKKATGDLPLNYLRQVRIDAAKERLETTQETIDKITRAVGYNDTSSFCRLFKKYTQVSPMAYREKFFQQFPW
jgi:transcriptional regulator GlxA family with amidase domain